MPGIDRFDARAAIVRDLEAAGALVRDEPQRHAVPVSSRSGAVVEPLLSLQWFCRMETLAAPALAAYRDGRIRFVPERFGRTYEHWLENIRDWNVSRQVWWGHRLPVWYTPDGRRRSSPKRKKKRARSQRERYGTRELRARSRYARHVVFERALAVLDSRLARTTRPNSNIGIRTQVLVTGREIIFLWVARMVMLGMHFAGDVPFRDVFIAPLVFDDKGRKMSKELGNAIDPMDLVAKYGADAMRMGIVRQMRLESQEMRFDERFVEKARDFNNKSVERATVRASLPEGLAAAPDGCRRWPKLRRLPTRGSSTQLRDDDRRVTEAYDAYEFGLAADTLLDFVWYGSAIGTSRRRKCRRRRARRCSRIVLNAAMRLLHPIAPFVTEEIWQRSLTTARRSSPRRGPIPKRSPSTRPRRRVTKRFGARSERCATARRNRLARPTRN